MCAMLSLIAAEELRISQRRRLRFLESYIGMDDPSELRERV